MPPDMEIRQMKVDDLRSVFILIQNTIEIAYRDVYPAEAVEFFKNYHREGMIRQDALSGYTVVAELRGVLLGTGTLLGTNIRRVFVSLDNQYKRVGKSIVQCLEKEAAQKGIDTLDLSASLTARQFWESAGYILQKEESILVANGKELRFYNMIKMLDINQ